MTRLRGLAPALGRRRDANEEPGASQGQILVMFALMSGALLGILGLAIDVGYSVSQRRSMQNAADLAAIAGAHAIAEFRTDDPISAYNSVFNVVDGNRTHEGPPTFECTYVDDNLWDLADCEGYVPADATGVRVITRETHDTFFMKIFGRDQVTTSAVAAARVERLFRAGMDAPILVCGYGTKLAGGGDMDILINATTVNPDAVGQTFRVVGTNKKAVDDPDDEIADCGETGNAKEATSWMGFAHNGQGQPNNDSHELNDTWFGRKGKQEPNKQRYNVDGVDGCDKGVNVKDFGGDADANCILLLPVAVSAEKPKTGDIRVQFQVTKVLAFKVAKIGATNYEATLLDDYPTFGGSVPGWWRDSGAVVVIKLKE